MTPASQLVSLRADPADVDPFLKYRDDFGGFCRHILGIKYLWDRQEQAVNCLLTAPYRAQCPAANEVGKTFIAAAAILWWFCTRSPAIVISTAPKFEQVKKLVWKEVRALARRAGLKLPFQPKACSIERAPDDFAVGTTARDATAFQGHHGPNMLFVIDEAIGVEAEFFEAIETMFSPPGHAVLAIYNPTDTTAHIYREYKAVGADGSPSWHIVRMPAIEHPNIVAELAGDPPPIPYAIRLGSFERRLIAWSSLVNGPPKATDIQWPPPEATAYIAKTGKKPRWYRPGPVAEARLLGRFPSQSVYSVWSDGDWEAACRVALDPLHVRAEPVGLDGPFGILPEIGCDVARFGDDNTAFHVRAGGVSLHHEWFNGQDTVVTFARCKQLAKDAAKWAADRRAESVDEHEIPIKIDDSGVGGGVTDQLRADGYNVSGINASTLPIQTEDYYRRRDELWFSVAEYARRGELDLSRLPAEILDRLRVQAMAPRYSLNAAGQRVVESKDKCKERTQQGSPDDMDALNLAYAYCEDTDPADIPAIGMRKANDRSQVIDYVRRRMGR